MERRELLIAAAVALVLVLGLAWVLWPGEEPAPPPEPAPVQQPTDPAEPEPEPEPEPERPLPPLEESDAVVRLLVDGLSDSPGVEPFLSRDDLVERFVVVVVNVADGEDPRQHLPFLLPERDFQAVERGDRLVVDPASYERYDHIAETVTSVDVVGAVGVLERIEPLLNRAYRELGHPDGEFLETFDRAIGLLLDTPIPTGEIELRPRTRRYEFADPALESLTPPQKQLIRMGPENAREVKTTLRELRALMVSRGLID